MAQESIETLIDFLPLEKIEKDVVTLVSSGKSQEEIIKILIKWFEE